MKQNQVVRIVPVDELSQRVIRNIKDALHTQYNLNLEVNVPIAYQELNIKSSEAPYEAERIINPLVQQNSENILLAVTRLPITHDGRKFIFGLANPTDSACIISTYQLFQSTSTNESIGPQTAIARVRKEATHEVGHILGYSHCENQNCVMRFSLSTDAVDTKSEHLCRECKTSPL